MNSSMFKECRQFNNNKHRKINHLINKRDLLELMFIKRRYVYGKQECNNIKHKGICCKPENMSSVFQTHMVEEDLQLLDISDLYMQAVACVYTHIQMYTHSKY